MSDELCYMPATEALRLFRSRDLSPVELMKAVIDRAEAVQPAVNAFTYTHFEEAMQLAREAEARYASGNPAGAIDGLPVAVKDESLIAGKPVSNGSFALEGYIAEHTSPVNQRVLAAGGIVHARTATPEFSCAGVTWTKMWGVCRNPWNTDYSPGGSSGGSGAALAAGMCTLATGSDIGGSIRVPASACGVVGIKAAYGRIPSDPPFNMDTFSHEGPMGRTVADTALLFNLMAGHHPPDIASLRETMTIPAELPRSLKGMRIAFSPDLGVFTVGHEVRTALDAAAERLRGLGAVVEPVELGWQKEWPLKALSYLHMHFGTYIASFMDELGDRMNSYSRAFAEDARHVGAGELFEVNTAIGKMHATLGPLLEEYDAMICPVMGLPGVPAELDSTRDSLEIDGTPVSPMSGWALTYPFNMLSRCPVLSVPIGHGSKGVPIGMQIVARNYREDLAFTVGAAYEASRGGWYGKGEPRPAVD